MKQKGTIKSYFPGGNTSYGFRSFYDYIMPQDEAKRIFVLKGGPGVGKSTLMKKIGEYVLEKGYDIEFHHCSSDNNSLDGVVIPSIKIAIIDGTAPHVVDPKNPGAIDEIINLGEFWDVEKMVSARDMIYSTTKHIARLYKIVYSYLAEAKIAYDEWKSYVQDSIDNSQYYPIVLKLTNDIFNGIIPKSSSSPKHRHLFASAITPDGSRNYVHTLLEQNMKVYALKGQPGCGLKEAIGKIAHTASEMGFSTQQFHCPIEPEFLDMVIIPELNTAVLNTSDPFHNGICNTEGITLKDSINFDLYINQQKLEEFVPELNDAKDRFNSLLNKAVAHILMAKAAHDDMEKYYIAAMDFEKLQAKRNEILQRILNYISTCSD